MQSKVLVVIGILVLIVSAVGSYFYFFQLGGTDEESVEEEIVVEITPPVVEAIEYGVEGFSPSSVNISIGTNIKFTNSSSEMLQVEFPENPEFNMAEIAPGEASDTLPFFEAGEYSFRNTENISIEAGTIIVE